MKKIILLALFVVFTMGAKAQDYFWALTWDMTLPVGETSDFIEGYQLRGIGVDNRWMYNETYSFGFYLGWQTMYERRDQEIYEGNNGKIQGTQFRYINSLPIVVNGHYYFNPYDKISVHAGAGLGLYWLEARSEIGLIAVVDKGWRFGFYPEAGIHVKMSRDTKILLNTKYNYVLGKDGGPNYTYLTFGAGISWGFF